MSRKQIKCPICYKPMDFLSKKPSEDGTQDPNRAFNKIGFLCFKKDEHIVYVVKHVYGEVTPEGIEALRDFVESIPEDISIEVNRA